MNGEMVNAETVESSRSYRWLLWLVAVVVYAADRLTKVLVIDNLALGESWRPWAGTPVLEWFALTHIKNSGAAFGIFPSGGQFFIVVAVVVSIGIIWYYPRLPREQWVLFLSLGLQLGGALGNLTDRLQIGHVTDFVHIGSFAIFNVADASLFCGAILLAGYLYYQDIQRDRAERAAALSAEAEEDDLPHHSAEFEQERERTPTV
jgi:signal peptidase II